MTVPFVGRREELSALGGLISRARRERAPAVGLIFGEPGSGKSRLLREAIAEVDPARLVFTAGFEPIESIPLAGTGNLLRRLATVPDHGPRLNMLAFGSNDLQGQGTLAVFEAAHRAHATFGPLVVVVDDLHWLDGQSLALLHYLISAAESAKLPLVVVAASRRSPATQAFGQGISGALPEARRVSIELRGLPMQDGVVLARAIDERLDQQSAEELWRRAAGSPFWLEALARQRGLVDALDLLTDRMRAMSADAGTLLNALVIGARPFARDELAAILVWPAERLDHALRELVGRGLGVDEPGTVRLAHDLIRESAGRVIPASTARTLHARFAKHLEHTAGDDLQLLAEALDHQAAAGLPTAALAARLVASSQRRLLGGEQLRRLSGIADALPDGSADQVELDIALGELASELWERGLAMRHWGRVAQRATESRLRLRAHVEAARAGYESGDPLGTHRHLAAARSFPMDAVTALELDTIEAEVRMWDEYDTPGGSAAAARATARLDELAATPGGPRTLPVGTRAAMLDALTVVGEAAQREDRPTELLAGMEAAQRLAESLGEEAQLRATMHRAFVHFKLGNFPQAAAGYRDALATARRLMLPRSMVEAAIYLARVLRGLGHLGEAQAVAREANALQARIRPWFWGEMNATVLNLIDLSLGDGAAFARIRADVDGLDPHYAISVHHTLATWVARRDGARRASEVDRDLAAARAKSALINCLACDRELRVVSAEVLARIGRVESARWELAAWEADYSGPSYVARDLWCARARASIELAVGSAETAEALDSLLAALDGAGRLEEAIWARMDLGRTLSHAGNRKGAIAAYVGAAAGADEIGAAGLARLAARGLRDLGVRAWRRGEGLEAHGRLGALSVREREVAGLVAGGASNSEIAAALVVSPKTVERHVTNILAKVGARNRTELASLVHLDSVRDSPDD